MWVLEVINSLDHNALDSAGASTPATSTTCGRSSPRRSCTSASPHLIDNTIPFVFMGVIIALRGAARLALVTLIVIVVGGLGTWLIAPGGTDHRRRQRGRVRLRDLPVHPRRLFNRSVLEILIGVVVGVVWGGALLSSVVPHHGISWQGHVCGAVGGVVAAWLLARPRAPAQAEQRSDRPGAARAAARTRARSGCQ